MDAQPLQRVDEQVKSGNFSIASDFLRDIIRREQSWYLHSGASARLRPPRATHRLGVASDSFFMKSSTSGAMHSSRRASWGP